MDSAAWITVGTLSVEDYRAVLNALEGIAELASATPVSQAADKAVPAALMRIQVNELEVRYLVEQDKQIVRLVGIK